MAVSVVVTACNRPDLLERTIDTFLKFNTYPIESWIISEDGGDPSVNQLLMEKYPHFKWIHGRRGQIKSIDDAYALVNTEYVLHWEEDWETYRGGFIEESIKILEETPTVSAVMLRKYGDGAYVPDTSPFLKCGNGWGFYSFNPGLRRMSDVQEWFPNGFSSVVEFDSKVAHSAERRINDIVKSKGYCMALTKHEEGFVRHIGWDRHVGPSCRIGLCMIVKDESHIIHESMECTLPLIDTYCIVDTGSSDNTVQIIKDFYQKHAIPGKVHERPWKDFGTNRSEALALCNGEMDYILVIDADDLMTFPANGRELLRNILKTNPSNALIDIRQGTLLYARSQIFKANDGWCYKGVLHEYPTNGKRSEPIHLPSEFWMESRRIGGRNKTGNKLPRDIEVLEKGVKDEPNNERYMFYLAQSYRDNGNSYKAIEWYTKRFEFGGWYEETYMAALNVARLTNSKEWAWKAHQVNPKRIECLVSYMSHCRAANKWSQELYAMALYASTIPKPTDQVLFLETDVYDWKVWDELSIISFYTGHKDTAWEATKKLLSNPGVPQAQRARIIANSKFGEPSDAIVPVRLDKTGFYWYGYMSECKYEGDILTFIRQTEKFLKNRASIIITDADGFVSDSDFNELPPSNKVQVRSEHVIDDICTKVTKKPVLLALCTRNVYRRNILLLPLDDTTFSKGLLLGDIPKWSSRSSMIVWRGKNTGNGIRQKVVNKLSGNKLADVGIVGVGCESISIANQLQYKYILIVDGMCIASNHQWVFGSGAVPIMVTHPGNNFWFKNHLRDMENCVFIQYDLSDLDEKLTWLVDHDAEAQKIAENALALSMRIFTPEFQRKYIEKELRSIVE
jgi:glycosyltransferase involved in cell wall biosynthesis